MKAAACVLTLLWSVSAASAAGIPKFDYARTCRDTPPVAMDQKATFKQCMADEESARDSLPQAWAHASAGARQQCSAMTQMGGQPSYVELLTCLEMENPKTRTAPDVGISTFHNPHPQPRRTPPAD